MPDADCRPELEKLCPLGIRVERLEIVSAETRERVDVHDKILRGVALPDGTHTTGLVGKVEQISKLWIGIYGLLCSLATTLVHLVANYFLGR